MKRLKKFFACLLCAVCLSTCIGPAVSADSDIRVIVNGAMLDFEGGEPQIIGTGTTMLPFRYIFEALGMTVSYHQGSDYFRIWAIDYNNDIRIDMYVGETTLYKSKNSEFDAMTDDGNRLLNIAQQSQMPEAPFIDFSGRTLVPARAIAESLGAQVDWDQATKTVTIKYDKVEYYGDFSKGNYPDTDIPTYYDVTGVSSTIVILADDGEAYEYKYDIEPLRKYLAELADMGMVSVYESSDTVIYESPTNRYMIIELDYEYNLMYIYLLTKPEVYYFAGADEEVPNYTFYTGRMCSSWYIDDEGDRWYSYSKTERELATYLRTLEDMGYVDTADEDDSFYLYEKGDANVMIFDNSSSIDIAIWSSNY